MLAITKRIVHLDNKTVQPRKVSHDSEHNSGEFVLIKPSGFILSIDESKAILGTAVSILLKHEEAQLSEIEAKIYGSHPKTSSLEHNEECLQVQEESIGE